MDPRKVSELKSFVQMCQSNPGILHLPEMSFFRTWMQRCTRFCFGGCPCDAPPAAAAAPEPGPLTESESEESEIEIDNDGVIEPDTDVPEDMEDLEDIEVTDEMMDQANEKKMEAITALGEGKAHRYTAEMFILDQCSWVDYCCIMHLVVKS
uniref:Hsp70-interacting protein N-terminal domain-containing protein n=1 Tax=Periophthalmus magnuspinnatus TaxID=409849 RepID=A0A3B4AXT1_9GOBI